MDRANVFRTMGATSFVGNREENDFYATEPKATELLLEKEVFNKDILEPCAGMGHIRDVLVSNGYNVTATDLIYRGVDDIKQEDVFNIKEFNGDIITNPPFSLIRPFFDLLIEYNKQFLFIGTIGSVGYLNVFREFKENRCWTGKTHPTNYVKQDGSTCKMGNTIWITNIGENVKELVLTKKYEDGSYIKYYNFDAINVDKVADIPYDYFGIMGVPITFIEKYNPNQFKIIGIDRLPYSVELRIKEIGEQWYNDFRSSGNKGHYTPNMRNLCLYEKDKQR